MRFSLFLTLFLLSFNTLAEIEADKIVLSPNQKESFGIKTMTLESASEVLGLAYPAEVVVPNSQLQVISALQGGLVESLMVAEGDNVKQGQVLARIQSPGLLELQRDLLQTLTKLTLAKSTLNRDKQLLDEGIIPKRRYLESRGAWQALLTEKEQLEATLQFSGMNSDTISELENKRKLSSAIIVTAPFDGVLLEQMVIPGQKLEAAEALFQLGKLSPLWLEIHVPVDVVNNLTIGDSISITEMNIEGEIITLGRKVHSADQGTLVRAVVTDNIEQLRPGQFVQTRLSIRSNQQHRYIVPRKAIVRVDKKTIIFIENKEGFTAIDISIIASHEEQQIITTPEAITSPVVINGTASLKAILTGSGGEG
jgi:RND family efflux transporter MFP subunit